MIELKTYAGSNVTPQNDAIMNNTNTLNNGIYYGCNVTIKDATTLHINAGQGIVYGRLFEVLDSDIPVSLSPSGTLLGQLYVHIDLSNIAAPIQILVDTGETLANLEDDPQLNIDSGITDMQLATFTVSTVGMSDLVETFKAVEPIRAVMGDADISAIGDGTVKGSIRTINTHLSDLETEVSNKLDGIEFTATVTNLAITTAWGSLYSSVFAMDIRELNFDHVPEVLAVTFTPTSTATAMAMMASVNRNTVTVNLIRGVSATVSGTIKLILK